MEWHMSAATWWKGLCGSEPLAPVASIIPQIQPSSAASERNWSLFGNTHTKVRKRLTNVRVEKLVGIWANLGLLSLTQSHPQQGWKVTLKRKTQSWMLRKWTCYWMLMRPRKSPLTERVKQNAEDCLKEDLHV